MSENRTETPPPAAGETRGLQTNETATSRGARADTQAQASPKAPEEIKVAAGQTAPAIPWDKAIDPAGNVIDPERVAQAAAEREVYLHGNPPDDMKLSETETVGDVRARQAVAEPDNRRIVSTDQDESGELSGRVANVTEIIEEPAPKK